MKVRELEAVIEVLSERITRSQLIQKIREIAVEMGKGGRQSEEWATARHRYTDDRLDIDYEVYAMGNEKLRVNSGGERVFEAAGIINGQLSATYLPVIKDDRMEFEVLRYKTGKWEKSIEALYSRINDDVPEELLKDYRERFGLDIK